jgi:hypothetical protein
VIAPPHRAAEPEESIVNASDRDQAASMDKAMTALVTAVFGGPPAQGTQFVCANPNADKGCGCRECAALRHLRTASCSVLGCRRRSRFRMTRTFPRPGTWQIRAEPDDPHADAEGFVELPRDPHAGAQDVFFVCDTIHVRTVINANPDRDSPTFGPITTTWDVREYQWRPQPENLPAQFAPLFAEAAPLRLVLVDYCAALGGGHQADAAAAAEELTSALVAVLHHLHQLRGFVPLPVDTRPAPDVSVYDELLPSRRTSTDAPG